MRTSGFGVLTLVPGCLAAANFSNTTITPSGSVATLGSTNIGDYIAAGLGFAKTATDRASSLSKSVSQATSTTLAASFNSSTASGSHQSGTSSLPESVSPTTSTTLAASLDSSTTNGSQQLDTLYANISLTGGNTVTKTSTSRFSSCQVTTNSRGQVDQSCVNNSTVITQTFTNTTWALATDVDECWTEWDSYWSMHKPSPATISAISLPIPVTTEVLTYLHTEGSYITDKTITVTSTAPTVVDNGGFTQTISQVVVTYTTILTKYFSATATSTSLWTRVFTPLEQSYSLISASNDPNWPAPGCTLPAVYPACQSQWDEYATHNAAPNPQPLSANCEFNFMNASQSAPPCFASDQMSWITWSSYVNEVTSPVCSQASITGELCTSLKDAYVVGHNYNLKPHLPGPAYFSSGSYSNAAPWFTGWTWPATQAFAPGCTLDCGRCAVTGGTIELLYFPPGLSHPATGPVVATTLGTVLTSPTYYISFASLYASDACTGVGHTLTSMIVAIPTSEPLSSLFATTAPCDAHRANNPWLGQVGIGTASFNVSDLLYDSVPYSIYTSQPYCASQMVESGSCKADSCPTTLPYRPLLVLSSQLLNTLDPAWATCSLDLRGLYDPPKALQPATAIVVPTQPGPPATTSATPANGPPTATPDPTAQPEQGDPSATQKPADPPVPPPSTVKSPEQEDPGSTRIPADPPAPPPSTIKSPEQEDPGPTQHPADPPAPPPSTIKPPDPPSGRTSASPAAGASEAPQDGPAPIPTHTSNQQIPADPAGVIISLIAGTSKDKPSKQASAPDPASAIVSLIAGNLNNGASKYVSAADSATLILGTNTAQDPPAQGSLSSGTGQVLDPGPIIFTVGSKAVTATPGHPLVVAGSTLSANAAVTVDGHTYSSGSAGLIVDGTSVVPPPGGGRQASAAVITIGSQVFAASAAGPDHPSAIVIDGTTLLPGGPIATIGGVEVSAVSAGLMVGGTQTIPLSDPALVSAGASSQAIFTLGGSLITAFLPSGTGNAIVVDGTTLSPGGLAATISGTVVSAGSAGLVIGSTQTIPLSNLRSASDDAASQAVFTLGHSPITAFLPSGTGKAIVIDGTTVSLGGPAATIDGTVVSAGGAGLVIGGTQTIPWSNAGSMFLATDSQAVITLGGRTFTAFLASGTGHAIVVDGTTLSLGGPAATIDGTVVSAGTAGVVIGGTQTIPWSNARSTSTDTASEAVLTLGRSTITAMLASGTGKAIIVDGTTLSPGGPAITVDGTEISVGTAGLVIGGAKTVPFTATEGPSQISSGRQTSSLADPSAAADPSSATFTTQSASRRTLDPLSVWIYAVLASCIVLAGVVIR